MRGVRQKEPPCRSNVVPKRFAQFEPGIDVRRPVREEFTSHPPHAAEAVLPSRRTVRAVPRATSRSFIDRLRYFGQRPACAAATSSGAGVQKFGSPCGLAAYCRIDAITWSNPTDCA